MQGVNPELLAGRDVSNAVLANEKSEFATGSVRSSQLVILGYRDFYQLSSDGKTWIPKIPITEIATNSYPSFSSTNDDHLSSLLMSASKFSLCTTCNMNERDCRGHPGFIRFGKHDSENFPVFSIYHPLCLRYTAQILTITCRSCGRFYYSDEEINKMVGGKAFEAKLKILYDATVKRPRKCNKEEQLLAMRERVMERGMASLTPSIEGVKGGPSPSPLGEGEDPYWDASLTIPSERIVPTYNDFRYSLIVQGLNMVTETERDQYKRIYATLISYISSTPSGGNVGMIGTPSGGNVGMIGVGGGNQEGARTAILFPPLARLDDRDRHIYREITDRAFSFGVTTLTPEQLRLFLQLRNRIYSAGLRGENPNEFILNFPPNQIEPRILPCAPSRDYEAKVTDGMVKIVTSSKKVDLPQKEAYKILSLISPMNAKLLGIHAPMHPRNYVMSGILVPGPKYMTTFAPGTDKSGKIQASGMMKGYVDILKTLDTMNDKGVVSNNSTIDDLKKKLYEHVKELIKPKTKSVQFQSQFEGIHKKFGGKKGLMRGNIQGKKGDYSGRGVISVETALIFGTAGVPQHHAETLTYRDTVRDYNYDLVMRLIEEDKINYIIPFSAPAMAGAEKGTGKASGKEERHRMTPQLRQKYLSGNETLHLGDIFERHLMDGDVVALNRPPSLHRGSIIAFRVKIYPGSVLRLHMYVTESYHADFDGDEMMIISPQDIYVVTEFDQLMHVKNVIMDPANSKPNIAPVYDSLIAVNKLTRINPKNNQYITRLTEAQFASCLRQVGVPVSPSSSPTGTQGTQGTHSSVSPTGETDEWDDSLSDKENITRYFDRYYPSFLQRARDQGMILTTTVESSASSSSSEEKEDIYLGPLVLSALLLPITQYRNKGLTITDGIISGTMKQAHIGFSTNSLVSYIYMNQGVEVLSNFLSNLSWVCNWFITAIAGYSIGLADCLELKLSPNEVKANITLIESEIAALGKVPDDPIRKARHDELTAAKMNTLKNKGDQIIKNSNMKFDNPLVVASDAGAKAKATNIAQMAGFLGPQTVIGEFMPLSVPGKVSDRPLAILAPGERSLLARTFAISNFIDGITPEDDQIHTQNARVGPVNIQNTTADTGYLQRRTVKSLEPYVQAMDRVTRNMYNNAVLEFAVGDTNLNPEYLVEIHTQKGQRMNFFIDAKAVADELNSNYGL